MLTVLQAGAASGADTVRTLRKRKWHVLVVGSVLSVIAWQAMRIVESRGISEFTAARADAVEIQLSTALTGYFEGLQRMGNRWDAAGSTPTSVWLADATAFTQQLVGIRSVQLVDPDYRIALIAPPRGNEDLIGLDIGIQEVKERFRRQGFEPITPFAVHGDKGLLFLVPLFPGGKFGGFILGVFGHDELFHRIIPSYLLDGLDLTVFRDGTEIYRHTAGTPNTEQRLYLEPRKIVLPGGIAFEIQVMPSAKLLDLRHSNFPLGLLLIGITLTLLVERVLFLRDKSVSAGMQLSEVNRRLEAKIIQLEEAQNTLSQRTEELKRQRRAALNIAYDAQRARSKAEAAERTTAHYKALVKECQDAIIGISLDSRITSWNDGAEGLFGFRDDEAVGQPLAIILPESRMHEADPILEQIRHGDRVDHFDTVRVDRWGKPIHVSVSFSPLSDGLGNIVGASSVIRDITERREGEERFQLAVESCPNAMVMVDSAGVIVLVNAQTERVFGYSRDELLGRQFDMLIPERYRTGENGLLSDESKTGTAGSGRELYGIRNDGSEVPIVIGFNPIRTSQGTFILSAIVDITQRKQSEEFMRKSLSEKDLLLKEIHHRVKNNMQVISSLLKLQSEYVPDPSARVLFKQSDERVRSMALIHERLYRSEGFADIDFSEYVRELSQSLVNSYAVDRGKVELDLDLQNVYLGIDQAIPCGLLLNEFISNALKHAFAPGDKGLVRITLSEAQGEVTLGVIDNGRGLPPDFDIEHPMSLGFEIIRTLSEQLEASLDMSGSGGTKLVLKFHRQVNTIRERANNGNSQHLSL